MKHQIKMIFFLLLGVAQLTMAQTVIRGVVSDANGPLPGANVLEQGTTNGVSTILMKYQITVIENRINQLHWICYTIHHSG